MALPTVAAICGTSIHSGKRIVNLSNKLDCSKPAKASASASEEYYHPRAELMHAMAQPRFSFSIHPAMGP
jgi:hypothetical protein